jgi:hypothetical protein
MTSIKLNIDIIFFHYIINIILIYLTIITLFNFSSSFFFYFKYFIIYYLYLWIHKLKKLFSNHFSSNGYLKKNNSHFNYLNLNVPYQLNSQNRLNNFNKSLIFVAKILIRAKKIVYIKNKKELKILIM